MLNPKKKTQWHELESSHKLILHLTAAHMSRSWTLRGRLSGAPQCRGDTQHSLPTLAPDPCSTASLASRLWPHPAKSTHTKGSALAGPPSRTLLPAPAPRRTRPAPRFHSTTPSPQSLHWTSYLKWSFCPTPPPWLSIKSSSFSGPPSKASCFSVV